VHSPQLARLPLVVQASEIRPKRSSQRPAADVLRLPCHFVGMRRRRGGGPAERYRVEAVDKATLDMRHSRPFGPVLTCGMECQPPRSIPVARIVRVRRPSRHLLETQQPPRSANHGRQISNSPTESPHGAGQPCAHIAVILARASSPPAPALSQPLRPIPRPPSP
jgi:hypothetical protein